MIRSRAHNRSKRRISPNEDPVRQLANVASFLRPVSRRSSHSTAKPNRNPTLSKCDQIAIPRLISTPSPSNEIMTPSRDTPSSCTQLPSDNASKEDRTTDVRVSSSSCRDDKDVETDSGGNLSGKAPGGSQEMLHADSDGEEGEEKEEEEESKIWEESGADSRENNTAVKESSDGESTAVSPQTSSIQNDDSIWSIASKLINLEAGSILQERGVLPSGRDAQNVDDVLMPGRYAVPRKYSPGGDTHLVGVPALMEHVQGNAFIQNGYAGLEALFQCEGLDLNDVQYLYNLLGQDGDVFDLVLRSRPNPPSEISLGAILASLGLKREIASLITEYEPGRLAQRVFGTVTALRRVLIKYREMENQVRKLGKTSISDALKAQSENRNLRRQHKFLGDYWAREVKRLLDEKYDSTRRFREDVRKIYHEREENKQALEEEVLALNEKLKDAAMHRQILERQLRQSRFDASLLMDFLNEHSTLSFNWERLQNLLAHFQKGTEPPSSWKTAISIMAHDDMTFQSKAYIPSSRRDDGDKTQAGLLPPGNLYSQSVDLTRNPPSGKSHLQTLRTGSGMRKGSFTKLSRKALAKVQWRPSDWDPVDEGCRPPLEKLVYTEQEAREALDVGVIWDQIRLDVRNTMRVGIKYRGALEWMREDRVAHALFHQTDLVSMLASMMYWKRLDESFWTKFVPERYFLAAEVRLEDLQVLNEQPPFWNPLPIEDENEIILPEAIHDYVDDKAKDEDYVDGEEADPEDEELDELVDESPCSRLFKRGRSSLSSDSEASKSKRIRAVKRSPLAHKKFEELTLAEKTVIESRDSETTS